MNDQQKHEWTQRLRQAAAYLHDISGDCPHCDPKGQVDCPMCTIVWHQAEALLNLARLIDYSEVTEDMPLAT